MKQVLVFSLFALMGISAALGFTPISSASAEQKQHKVAICHGTASEKNPYVLIVVDRSESKATSMEQRRVTVRITTPISLRSMESAKNRVPRRHPAQAKWRP